METWNPPPPTHTHNIQNTHTHTTATPQQGAFAIGAEETLVVCSMFVPQNWTLHHYQDYTLLARNTLEHLHMVGGWVYPSILWVKRIGGGRSLRDRLFRFVCRVEEWESQVTFPRTAIHFTHL